MKCEVSVYSSDCGDDDDNCNKIEEIITYTEKREIETLNNNQPTNKIKQQEQIKSSNLINRPTTSKTSSKMIDNDVKINLSIHNDNIKIEKEYNDGGDDDDNDNDDDDDEDEDNEEDENFYHYKNSNNRNLLNSTNSNCNNDSGLEDENSNDEDDTSNNRCSKKIVIKQIKKKRRIYGEEYSILNSFNIKPCAKLLKIDPIKVENGSEPSSSSSTIAATTSIIPTESTVSSSTTTNTIPNGSLDVTASKFLQSNNNMEAIPTPTKRRYVIIDIDFDDIPTPCKDCFAIECHCKILNKHVPYI
jgi:hypothetical protein